MADCGRGRTGTCIVPRRRAVQGVARGSVGGSFKQEQVTLTGQAAGVRNSINRVVTSSGRQPGGWGRVTSSPGAEYMSRGEALQDRGDIRRGGPLAQEPTAHSDSRPRRGFRAAQARHSRGVVDYKRQRGMPPGHRRRCVSRNAYDVSAGVKKGHRRAVKPALPEGMELLSPQDRYAVERGVG